MTICVKHYVPIPGGGLATPGEILSDETAAKFTQTQIEHLRKRGAIALESDEPVPADEPEVESEPQVVSADIDGTEGVVKLKGRRKKA